MMHKVNYRIDTSKPVQGFIFNAKRGENLAELVKFDLKGFQPVGDISKVYAHIRKHGSTDLITLELPVADGVASWDVTTDITDTVGTGFVQLQCEYNNGAVQISSIYNFVVGSCLNAG